MKFSPARIMVARHGMEDLAVRCLREAVTGAAILAGNEPERISWELAGQIASRMAFAIRKEVAARIDQMLTDEGAGEFLSVLALQVGKDILEEGKKP